MIFEALSGEAGPQTTALSSYPHHSITVPAVTLFDPQGTSVLHLVGGVLLLSLHLGFYASCGDCLVVFEFGRIGFPLFLLPGMFSFSSPSCVLVAEFHESLVFYVLATSRLGCNGLHASSLFHILVVPRIGFFIS